MQGLFDRPWAVAMSLLVLASAGCGSPTATPVAGDRTRLPAPGPPGPPVVVALDATDSDSAALLTDLLSRARDEPDSAEARANLGMAYEVNGMTRTAGECYAQAVALDPDEARWVYYLAQARALLGELDGALVAIDRAIELDAGYGPAHLYRGWWLLDLGRPEEALTAFEAAASLDDDGPASSLGRARALIRTDRAAEAVGLLTHLSQTYRHPYVYQLLGEAHRRNGDMQSASAMLARARPTQRPGWPDPWHNAKAGYQVGFSADLIKADMLLGAGRVADAIALLEGLYADRPEDEALLNTLAIAHRRAGDEGRAVQILEDGIDLHPDYFPFYLNLSTSRANAGDLDGALALLQRAIEINPTLGWAHAQKGQLLLRVGRREEALAAFNESLMYDARDSRTHYATGVLLIERGDHLAAVERLQQAMRLSPGRSEIYVALARALIGTGQLDSAGLALDRAASLGASGAALDNERRRLANAREGASE